MTPQQIAEIIRAAADEGPAALGEIGFLSAWVLIGGPVFLAIREYCDPVMRPHLHGLLHGLTKDECRAFLHLVACAIDDGQ